MPNPPTSLDGCYPIFATLTLTTNRDDEIVYVNGSLCDGNPRALLGGWSIGWSADNVAALGTFSGSENAFGKIVLHFNGAVR